MYQMLGLRQSRKTGWDDMSREKTLKIAPDKIQTVTDRKREKFPHTTDEEFCRSLGISRTLYYKFKRGEGIGESSFHYLCSKLDFDIKEIGIPDYSTPDEPQRTSLPSGKIPLDRSSASLPSSRTSALATGITTNALSSFQLEFAPYVEDRTWKFVGRHYVFHKIERFFSQNRNGYFTVIGEPGQGKTAILAKYSNHLPQNTFCVAYFNIRNQGKDSVNRCLESICTRLTNILQIEYKVPRSFSDSSTWDEILQKASAKLNDRRLVIIIDALDEVDLSSQSIYSNILFLPQALPKNVYFLLSRRPYDEMLERLVISSPQEYFDLRSEDINEAVNDIRNYIQSFFDDDDYKDRINIWIENQSNITKHEFIRILCEEKSERNFMYIKQIMTDIANGNLENIEINKLPKGLEQYYKSHWQLMGMNEVSNLNKKFEIMYVLAKERNIASSSLIARIVEEVSESYVETVLRDWIQFLRVTPEIDNTICYGIYHYSFNEFLLGRAKSLPGSQIKSLDARRVQNLLK